jgi:hypothetical protein
MKTPGSILEFVQGPDRKFSATRLVFLAYATVFIVVWAWASFDGHALADVPDAVGIILLSLMAGKAVQSFGESKDTSDSDTKTDSGSKADAADGSKADAADRSKADADDGSEADAADGSEARHGQHHHNGRRHQHEDRRPIQTP